MVSTQNSLFGKVYVASPDSPYLTIIRTDQDIVDTTVLVQGNVVDVRASTQNGTAGNANVSRKPGSASRAICRELRRSIAGSLPGDAQ